MDATVFFRPSPLLALVLALPLLAACPSVDDDAADDDAADDDSGGDELDVAICAPDGGPFTVEVDNEFLPLAVGHVHVLEGLQDGADEVRVQFTVLDETEVVAGVTTRVLEEREWEDGELVEVSRNFFAQTGDGTVCYFGEDVDDYENGQIVGHGGAWRAGLDDAAPGIMMPGVPSVGQHYQMEVAPGVAEEWATIAAMGDEYVTPGGTFQDVMTVTEEPLGIKRYAPGTGMIYDDGIEYIEP